MKLLSTAFLVLFANLATATHAYALLIPFSKERIAANGPHCVHGYDGNFGQVGMYYAGSTRALNESIEGFFVGKGKAAVGMEYATKTLTLRPGPMVVPSYVNKGREISTNWEVQIWFEPVDGRRAPHINVNVWLGGDIKLDELSVPSDVVVKSGGEIDSFISKHRSKSSKSTDNAASR